MPSYLITGASRGLGYAWLSCLSAGSNTVVGLVRNKAPVQQRLELDDIRNVHLVEADITNFESLHNARREVSSLTNGSLDVLINNAVFMAEESAFKTVTDLDQKTLERELDNSFQTNVIGLANVINAFLPMIRRGSERKIISISSLLADLELANKYEIDNAAPYSVSKAAMNVLISKYHTAIGNKERILFMSLSPGIAKTRDVQPSPEEIQARERLSKKLKEYAPHFGGPLSPDESVKMQLQVIQNATVQTHGGAFISHLGGRQWL